MFFFFCVGGLPALAQVRGAPPPLDWEAARSLFVGGLPDLAESEVEGAKVEL